MPATSMRKTFALAGAAFVLPALAACSNSASSTGTKADVDQSSQPTSFAISGGCFSFSTNPGCPPLSKDNTEITPITGGSINGSTGTLTYHVEFYPDTKEPTVNATLSNVVIGTDSSSGLPTLSINASSPNPDGSTRQWSAGPLVGTAANPWVMSGPVDDGDTIQNLTLTPKT